MLNTVLLADTSQDDGTDLLLLSFITLGEAAPLAVLGVLVDILGGFTDLLAGNLGSLGLLGESGLGADTGVNLSVKFFHVLNLGGGEALGPVGELLLELSGISLLEQVIVDLDVVAENVITHNLGIEVRLGRGGFGGFTTLVRFSNLLGLGETGETAIFVGHVDTSIRGTLHATEASVTSGSTGETNIKESLERAAIAGGFNLEVSTINLLLTLEHSVHLLEVQEATGSEETSSVSSGVVGKTGSKTELLELLRGS